ncbi:MAG: hypothetical protein ABI147_02915 [Acidobacteriaceae bacterium]
MDDMQLGWRQVCCDRRPVIVNRGKQSRLVWLGKTLLGIGLMTACASVALAADTVTGAARNLTRGQSAAGDEVVLFRLDRSGHGREEQARSRTDAQGAFIFTVKDVNSAYVVRVIHQGVNYDRHIALNSPIAIDVFDATAKAPGVAGSIEVIRIGSRGDSLHVSDMVEIRNASSPPLTQAGKRAYEVWLPAQAKIDSVLAAGADNVGVAIPATPLPGEPGHYAVDFPLRPGSTKFAFNYDLPYRDKTTFRARNLYPLNLLTVMIPPTMRFASSNTSFKILATGDKSYQVEAVTNPKAGENFEFQISGAGTLPPLPASRTPAAAPAQVTVAAQPRSMPLDGSVTPVAATRASQPGSKWWVVSAGAAFLLAVFGLWLVNTRRQSAHALPTSELATPPSTSPVEAIKEVLFQLEMDRARGTISREDYANSKRALEGMVMRTMTSTRTAQAAEPTTSLTS